MANNYNKSIKDTEVFHSKCFKLHCEIRKAEQLDNSFTSKDGKEINSSSILVKVDDDEEERVELIDKNMSHLSAYKKGQVGTMTLRMDIMKEFGSKYTAQMLVVSFEEDKMIGN